MASRQCFLLLCVLLVLLVVTSEIEEKTKSTLHGSDVGKFVNLSTKSHSPINWEKQTWLKSAETYLSFGSDQPTSANWRYRRDADFSTGCDDTVLDLLFVVDTSASIFPPDFELVKYFLVDVVFRFNINDDKTRIGLVTFADETQLRFQLHQIATKIEMIETIRDVSHQFGPGTFTWEALKYARTVMFTPENGDRPEAPNVVVVITDGNSQIPSLTAAEAEQAKSEAGIHIVAVGVGLEESEEELRAMASEPAEDNMFNVHSFDTLDTALLYTLLSNPALCSAGPSSCPEGMYRCAIGKCVISEDECVVKQCPRGWFRCRSGHCLWDLGQLCDGHPNCADRSDEAGCYTLECRVNEYRCPDGSCVPLWRFRGVAADCGQNDVTDAPSSCPEDHFRCRNGNCIPRGKRCDERARDDCGDNTDEEGCLGMFTPQPNCPGGVQLGEVSQTVQMDWEGTGGDAYCKWWIQVDSSLGVVIQVEDLHLTVGENPKMDDVLRVHYDGNVMSYKGDSLAEPLVVVSDYVWFELTTYFHNSSFHTVRNLPQEDHGSGIDNNQLVPRFRLTYTAYPRNTLPLELEAGLYSCSLNNSVPPELQCDGFAQCLQAEDELDYNCSYTSVGCQEGWTAGGSFCLKFVFPQTIISPDGARQECRDRYQAELGSLPHPRTRRLAASLLVRKGFDKLIVGLERVRFSTPGLRHLYRFLWQWTQAGTEFDGPLPTWSDKGANCATLTSEIELKSAGCAEEVRSGYVCSKLHPAQLPRAERTRLALDSPLTASGFRGVQDMKKCPSGQHVHPFHPCGSLPEAQFEFPGLQCGNGRSVQYPMLCDGHDDCGDLSDETNCHDFGTGPNTFFMCTTRPELVDSKLRCNGVPDCHDASDEDNCTECSKGTIPCGDLGCMPCGMAACSSSPDNTTTVQTAMSGPRSWRVDLDAQGVVTAGRMIAWQVCPESHFSCGPETNTYCIPSFLLANGQRDCPVTAGVNSSADEPSGELTCPGHYRCYRHAICIHPTYFCDGVYHCPLKDDERYCDLPCPKDCVCQGHQFRCSQMFNAANYPNVRYLDLNGTHQPSLLRLHHMGYLGFLNLSRCGLTQWLPNNLIHLRLLDFSSNNLVTLDVEKNTIPSIEVLKLSSCGLRELLLPDLLHLRELELKGNRLRQLTLVTKNASTLELLDLSSNSLERVSLSGLYNLHWMDLSNNELGMVQLDEDSTPNVTQVNLSHSALHTVSVLHLPRLQVLDLSHNDLKSLSRVTLSGLPGVIHLNLSHNALLPTLDEHFQLFVRTSGIVGLHSLLLRNTDIQPVMADPFVGMDTRPHLDTMDSQVGQVGMEVFSNWTSQLSLLEADTIHLCCAYYRAFRGSNATCKTSLERVFPQQCDVTHAGSNRTQNVCDVGWLLFESVCLRFVFPLHKMTVGWTAYQCQLRFSTDLAALPTLASRTVVESLLQLSGYRAAIVGLGKVSTDSVPEGLYHQYRLLWRWANAGMEFDVHSLNAASGAGSCVVLHTTGDYGLAPIDCDTEDSLAYVCSKPVSRVVPRSSKSALTLPRPSASLVQFPSKVCADGTIVHTFHPCGSAVTSTEHSVLGHSVRMHCRNKGHVHYTLTCDGHNDCGDQSDEENCADTQSDLLKHSFLCQWLPELVDIHHRCDGVPDCSDGSDEESCSQCAEGMVLCAPLGCLHTDSAGVSCSKDNSRPFSPRIGRSVPSSSNSSHTRSVRLLSLDRYGLPSLSTVAGCPETHFQCAGDLCLPQYLVNNGVPDCPLSPADDETFSSLSCPGYYRCYRSGVCLHPHYLCDGTYHCPLKDDERYCDLSCPHNCTCEGLAYRCWSMFDLYDNSRVRYLDLSGTFQPIIDNLTYLAYLGFFNLSFCHLDSVHLEGNIYLRVLDLSHNHLQNLTSLVLGEMPLLTHLNVSKNPLVTVLGPEVSAFLARAATGGLLSLGISSLGIQYIEDETFHGLTSLRHVDLRGNAIRGVNKGMFVGLTDLQILETDDPRLCCPYFHVYPNRTMDCRTPIDELSSCSDLLRSDFFRVCLWTLSAMTVIGNIGVVVYRFVLEPQGTSPGFRVLVTNLCAADSMMGIYLVIIGAADSHYRGQYIWQQEAWTDSALCQTAGFLALLSSEVSAFMICLVTLDRLLVLCFPFSHHLHMTPRSTAIACGVAWLVGVILAVVPLLPTEWKFYGQTGICLPLPITRRPFPGQQYAFVVFVVLNFLLFVLIGAGQLVIFRAIHSTPMASRDFRRKQDMAIARRLFLIVFSDFCCWFPIGLMGLLANHGTPIPGDVNVWAAIFILPVNSALNPFLYTLGMVLEKWLRKREERRIQRTLATLHTDLTSWSEDKLQELHQYIQQVLTQKAVLRKASSSVSDRDTTGLSQGVKLMDRQDFSLLNISSVTSQDSLTACTDINPDAGPGHSLEGIDQPCPPSRPLKTNGLDSSPKPKHPVSVEAKLGLSFASAVAQAVSADRNQAEQTIRQWIESRTLESLLQTISNTEKPLSEDSLHSLLHDSATSTDTTRLRKNGRKP